MYQTLFESVSAMMEMPEADKQLCYDYFEPVTFPKNHLLEVAGKIPQHQYFIVKGYLRNFYYNELGEEVTTDMNNGPRFFTSYTHFMNRTVSNEALECITECSLLRIKRDDVDILFERSIILKDYTILILQKFLEEDKTRLKELATLNAEQRYLKFLKEQSNIVHNVPLQYIASYLGMKPESLSRIRKKIIS
ncbi:Crp/Fnr family transcriptional regulator [Runella aurantiaca]|uniref:Crp/Fnr family transcriptional regulator n=1 Tax=Runella aurantiaca TaxID=2282308 RepID=A0A369I754_9BACT|nr:Crp/Fnr family transcriptional regulator [Runella aurantiaca]RDB05599.1 Crp/Fnr family transcriptional regulator [Runella aurantiaca]